MLIKVFALLGLSVALVLACTAPEGSNKQWWETAQFYQIYPRSFKDSNGDGIGDLNGITSKLEYLKEIGITATWLSPIFTSPMADFGYDISDFEDIQPEYGTLQDFDAMMKKANELGIKIILDFVPNHSSDEHEWFVKSENRVKGYEDLYFWVDGKVDPQDPTKRLPPTNWISVFRGSAWKWSDTRKQFYYHAFIDKQPDLNYRSPTLVKLMKNVLKFWLDRGVAGFRVDAVPNLFEIAPQNGAYPDEPVNPNEPDEDNYDHLQHIYVIDRPETVDMVYQWRQVLQDHQQAHGGDERILMIETYSAPAYSNQFYGNKTTEGAQIPFNFNLITRINTGSTADDIVEACDAWMNAMPAGKTANWVVSFSLKTSLVRFFKTPLQIGNHDQNRAATRYGVGRKDFMNMLVMVLPGISVTYQGEEIGMLDVELSWEETVDPAGCNSNPDIYEQFSRDPTRTPFQWDSTKNAGFSTGPKTWLPVGETYQTLNVAVESSGSGNSHLKIYKALIELRKNNALKNGDHRYFTYSNVFFLKRWINGGDTILLICNLNPSTITIDLWAADPSIPDNLKVSIISVNSGKVIGSGFGPNVQLAPDEAVVAISVPQKKFVYGRL